MDYVPATTSASVPNQGPSTSKAGPSSEALYWRRFRNPTFIKEYAPISHIAFVPAPNAFTAAALESSSDPNGSSSVTSRPAGAGYQATNQARARFAVTTGPRVQIYSARTNRVLKTITRFSDVARSAEIRADGRLIVAADDGGKVQVFDVNSRAILRSFSAHRLAAHVAHFSPNPTTILSASDDATVQLHDIPSTTTLRTFTGHDDYVRTALVSPDNPDLVLSGSYDQTVRLWDARVQEKGGEVMRMRHGAPVESCLVYPTGGGGVAVSAGGPVVRAWDLMMGGRGLKAVSNHQKTITSLALSMSTGAEGPDVGASGGGMRLLSAGVDGLVKVYDPARDYTVVHTMRYPSPILSLAVSPEERELAVGMADGTLCVRKREVKKGEDEARAYARKAITGGGVEAFVINNMEEGAGAAGIDAAAREEAARKRSLLLSRDDVRAETVRTRRLKPYESLLRSFRYSEAIDASLGPGVPAAATFAVLTELKRRGAPDDVGGRRGAGGAADGLARGLAGRDDVGLEPVLRFLLRHAANPMWTDIVADVLEVVLDIYSSTLGLSPLTDSLFSRLWAKLSDEVKLQRQVEGVRGGLEMLLNRSLIGR
ncbi:WD40 repeat-like protein [Jaminaea rosea]|uniref:WD40 repeat-like protein n=1 Tax=Jaminaea rosea TaxID=1569628 RepID=A0A316US51_9BASI|nr:WD40 repeat-like protein [Jaminaea rosea]PWN28116.1 WD40 repeat-like protein [Jaminaea rosea]